MTSQPSPTYNFPGISYNPSYFKTASSTGLTTATANNLYLRKTYADTATSLETFSGGIATSNIDSLTASTNMTIGTNINNGNTLSLGTTASKLLIPGPIDKIYCSSIDAISTNLNMYIGQFGATALVLGSATCQTSAKNFTATTGMTSNGSINISGIYDLNLTTGTVFTPKIDATGSLTVGGNASTTSLLLGSSTCPTTIQGNTVSIDTAAAGTMSIGNTNATTFNIGVTAGNTINIGKTTGTTTMNGTLSLLKPMILGSTPTATGQLGYLNIVSMPFSAGFTSGTSLLIATIDIPVGTSIITAQIKINVSASSNLTNSSIYLNNSTYLFNPSAQTFVSNTGTCAYVFSPFSIAGSNYQILQLSTTIN